MNRSVLPRLVGYVLFALCLTVVFTVLNFPGENLTTAVNGMLARSSNGALTVEAASIRFPKARGAALHPPGWRRPASRIMPRGKLSSSVRLVRWRGMSYLNSSFRLVA